MAVLIISIRADVHAHAAKWALAHYGVTADVFCHLDFPQHVTGSFTSSDGKFRLHGPQLLTDDYNVVWNRRSTPVGPHAALHPTDKKLATYLGSDFLRAYSDVQDEQVFWVNSPAAAARAERKAYQLATARRVGFNVPDTLISNDPQKIRRFVEERRCVVKPLAPMGWDTGSQTISLPTTRVVLKDLDDDIALQGCPMIYQEEIKKTKEYRVVVFGREIVCVELSSPCADSETLDWRSPIVKNEIILTEISCPDHIARHINQYMDALDLRSASFDFALSSSGDWIFFEANQQGQFLWIEMANTEIHLLDRCAQFLMKGRSDFRYVRPSNPLTFSAYLQDHWQEDLKAAKLMHMADPEPLIMAEYEY